mgnify:CR=1 FL=1
MRPPHYKFFSNAAAEQTADSPTHQKPRQAQAKSAALYKLKSMSLPRQQIKSLLYKRKNSRSFARVILHKNQCEACRFDEDNLRRAGVRHFSRWFIIQSRRALSYPMSCPAFSDSSHLCFIISSRSARNSLYTSDLLSAMSLMESVFAFVRLIKKCEEIAFLFERDCPAFSVFSTKIFLKKRIRKNSIKL